MAGARSRPPAAKTIIAHPGDFCNRAPNGGPRHMVGKTDGSAASSGRQDRRKGSGETRWRRGAALPEHLFEGGVL